MSLNYSTTGTPLLVLHAHSLSSIQFPRDWCDNSRDLASCMCEEQRDVLVTDISAGGDDVDSFNYTHEDTEGDLAHLVDWWTEGVVLPVICGIGIFGNIASILVLTNKEIDLKPSFVNILICLAFYDLMFEILAILMYSLPNISPEYHETIFPHLLPYLLPLIHITLTGSVYTTIAVAMERCVTVMAPFTQVKSYNGFLYVCPIILFSLIYNIPKFFEVRTRCSITVASINGSSMAHWVSDKYIWDKSEVRSETKYMTYITANCIVMGLLPMLFLTILNWLIFRAISRARALHASLMSGNAHRRDSTMATVLTSIVIIFVVCHTPKAALNIYEVWTAIFMSASPVEEDPKVILLLDILTNISHLLIVTNSSVNIIVYALKDFKFRQVLWSFFCGPTPHFNRSGYSHPTKSYPSKTGILEDTGISTNMGISNITNMVDMSLNDSQGSENKVLSTDF